MNALTDLLPPGFLAEFITGMIVNFRIAGLALVFGLALGLPLAYARAHGGFLNAVSSPFVALMRAAPTFVLMFFILNAIPPGATLFGAPFELSGEMIVALSLAPYSAAFVTDSGVDALKQMRTDSHLGALLFFPNVTRAFFVMVMSSSAGAAINVQEGISVILRHTAHLPTLNEKLLIFAIGIILFSIPLQLGFAALNLLRSRLGRGAPEAA